MATEVEGLSLAGKRKAHLRQLLWCIEKVSKSGEYYGNKVQFEKRQADLLGWISESVEYMCCHDIVFPKE